MRGDKGLIFCLFLTVVLLVAGFAVAENGSSDFPRNASLKRDEVNVRAGPGTRYPILWIFQRSGWPVKVLAKYDNWYKIRDLEGEEGWVYIGMISGQETAVISNAKDPAVLYKKADAKKPIYRLASGVVVGVEDCTGVQCQVSIRGSDGWVARERLVQLQ